MQMLVIQFNQILVNFYLLRNKTTLLISKPVATKINWTKICLFSVIKKFKKKLFIPPKSHINEQEATE